jgi:hypothetical protein
VSFSGRFLHPNKPNDESYLNGNVKYGATND